jgi:alkylation response protein AidB-like acyl-CoA dehydrogenase
MQRTLFEPDHDSFRESVRRWIDRSVMPRADELADLRQIPDEIWTEAGDLGFLGLEIPEDLGGSDGQDYRFNTVLVEELARVNMAMPTCFGIHSDIVAPYLVKLAEPSLAAHWLPRVSAGDLRLAIAMTEPSGGSDLAALRTTAKPDGEDWIISGSKTFITNGSSCGLVVVAARTTPDKGARGISLFAVEEGMTGFNRGRKLNKIGQPESDTAELFFDEVRVPASHLLGERDGGFIHMMELLPQERLHTAITNLAHAAHILRETVDYANERQTFNKPLTGHQHIKFKLAELDTALDVAQAYVDHCVTLHCAGKLTAIDAAKAKLWTSEAQNEILDACVQIWGGYGYMTEYRAARAWRDARPTRIYAGSNEIMKEIIGRSLSS